MTTTDTTIDYHTDCPSCGRPLEVAATRSLDPDTAPWLCNACRRGFWAAELSAEARAAYRVEFHDYGHGPAATAVRRAVQAEWLHAHARGTSLRSDQSGGRG